MYNGSYDLEHLQATVADAAGLDADDAADAYVYVADDDDLSCSCIS